MGEVITFQKREGKYDNRTRRVLSFVQKKVKYARNVCDNINSDSIDELNYLDAYLSNLIIKTKNHPWKSDKVQKRYIHLISEYNKEFKNCPKKRVNIVFYELVLTYLFDIYPKLAFEDKKFIKNIVNAFDIVMNDGNISTNEEIKNKMRVLTAPIIKKTIESDEEEYTSENMIDIISMVEAGNSIPEILSVFKETDEIEDEINLDKGTITIERIHDYYKFQNDLFIRLLQNGNSPEEEKKHYGYYDSLGYMYSINNFDDRNKMIFIFLVNEQRKHNRGIQEDLKFVCYLSDIYKRYKDLLNTFDEEIIRNLVYFRMLTDCDMEVLDDVVSSDTPVSKNKKF